MKLRNKFSEMNICVNNRTLPLFAFIRDFYKIIQIKIKQYVKDTLDVNSNKLMFSFQV